MNGPGKTASERRQYVLLSLVIFAGAVGLMAYLRLYLLHDRFVSLTYGLPLLICLWHRDLRLLWSLAATFVVMSWWKAFRILPDADPTDHWELLQWLMQVVNIVVIGGTVHAVVRLTEVLRAKNAALEQANEELLAQAEELAQQNEEIEQQEEELRAQNEELQQQNEELQQQQQELQAQAEELESATAELNARETMLQTLLKAVSEKEQIGPALQEICESVLLLFGGSAQCATVLKREGDDVILLAQAGLTEVLEKRWPFEKSLAAVAVEHGRTASIHDLADRPDLMVPCSAEFIPRSSIATPLRIREQIFGVLELHASTPQAWTGRKFRMIEWAAAQCALVIETSKLREELTGANTRLERTVSERTAELHELVNELEHFSYTITHDMRAPLRSLQGFAGILAADCRPVLDEEHGDYLERIVQSSNRMDRLITDALSYSKAIRAEHPPERVDVAQLLKGILSSYPQFQPPLACVEIAGELPAVLANTAGLTQCLSNLIGNAVKFVEPGKQPRVVVRAERTDGMVRLWFEDNGIGFPPAFHPRLFQMFQRGNTQFDGTGIGLALVKKTCERMGGRVGAKSQPGQGSQFWIELKAAPELEICRETTP